MMKLNKERVTKVQTIDQKFEAPMPIDGHVPLQTLEFGLKSVEHIPYAYLNVFTQTRKSNPTWAVDELVASIEAVDTVTGKPKNQLLHPPFVNILEPDTAADYVTDLNSAFGTAHTLAEARPRPDDDNYPIVVAGHRRRLAVGKILIKQFADPETSTVASNTVYGLSFGEALRIQLEENVHLQLPVYEVARAIQVTYQYGLARGDFKTMADCVRALPFGEDKVRSALRFCELPGSVQTWVEDERLSYGSAVALHPVMSGLRRVYSYLPSADREQVVEEAMLTWALRIINYGWGKDTVTTQVQNYLQSLEKDNELRFFDIDAKREVRRARQTAYHELFRGGLTRLRDYVGIAHQAEFFRSQPDEQKEAVLEELQGFVDHLGSLATKKEAIPSLFTD